MNIGGLYPPEEQEAIKAELLKQLGVARSALDMAAGLARGLDYQLLGFDSRKSLVNWIELTRERAERGIDALQGDQLDSALIAYEEVAPAIGLILKAAGRVIRGF